MLQTKATALFILAACEVSVMALWFSTSAVLPSITLEYDLSATQRSLFTSAVQIGFVCGTLISTIFTLADRFDPRRLFMLSAIVAALANAAILGLQPTGIGVPVMRFITGMCMAGVYPVGMKMAGSWAKGDLGLLVAILVGALTLGSASPHLFNALGGIEWRFTIAAASVIALIAGLLVNLVALGPGRGGAPPTFGARNLLKGFQSTALRLANFGYLGHMWELYAMWAWLGIFLDASFRLSGGSDPEFWARLTTFAAIGGGFIGCLAGGLAADRYGRTTVTIAAMAVSGMFALIVGQMFGASPLLLAIACVIWGISIVADSAQFSASVAELSEPRLVGTMLTAQTCAGFLLTLATIHLMPILVERTSWATAFSVLALGPLFGIISMARLRRHRDSIKLANGKR